MTFLGGEVTIPTPTRAALILSARDWQKHCYVTGEELLNEAHSLESSIQRVAFRYLSKKLLAQLERIEKALVELEGLEK